MVVAFSCTHFMSNSVARNLLRVDESIEIDYIMMDYPSGGRHELFAIETKPPSVLKLQAAGHWQHCAVPSATPVQAIVQVLSVFGRSQYPRRSLLLHKLFQILRPALITVTCTNCKIVWVCRMHCTDYTIYCGPQYLHWPPETRIRSKWMEKWFILMNVSIV